MARMSGNPRTTSAVLSKPGSREMVGPSESRAQKADLVRLASVAVENVAWATLVAAVRSVVADFVVAGALPVADAEAAVQAFEARLPDEVDPTEELGPYFDTAGLRKRLGVTRQALNGRVHRNTLLGVETDEGPLLYPSWQFTPEMGVVEGLPQLLRVLHQTAPDGFSKAMWLTSRQPRFGGRSAVDLLWHGGDLEELLEAAQADVDRLAS